MIQLFNGMQSSLSMVYDHEMGNMRTLLVSPLPRWFLLVSKLAAGVAVGILQVYVFLAVAWFWEVRPPPMGYLYILPALILTGLMLGSVRLLLSSLIKQLENFAGVMNFVIFPLFFALPRRSIRCGGFASRARCFTKICLFNPFTHAVELIRFAMYGRVDYQALAVVVGCTALFLSAAILAYDPTRGFIARRGGPGGGGESQ